MNRLKLSVILTIILMTAAVYFSEKGYAEPINDLTPELLAKGIVVNLHSPTYSDGVLSTCEGGVITGPNIRIQASSMVYTNKAIDSKSILTVEAEGNVMLEFGEYLFIGTHLSYDFLTHTGAIYNARTGIEPWFLGGEKIILCSDDSYIIYNGFITTSENVVNDWQIFSTEATLVSNRFLQAKNVQFRIFSIPLFWLSCFKTDLDTIFDSPISYNVQWHGRQHTRFSMSYEIFSWDRCRSVLQLDYRLQRGPGISLETEYLSKDHKTSLNTTSYMARDSSIDDPRERFRYLFHGASNSLWDEDRISVDVSWDVVSDKDMATDYADSGLELDAAGPTQIHVRRQEDQAWIANFLTRLRVNGFQTVKQELPTFAGSLKPFVIGSTGIISENECFLSYLNFEYGNNLSHVRNYQSTRMETNHKIYRSFKIGPFINTPEIGGRIIVYGNSPHDNTQVLTFCYFAHELTTQLHKHSGNLKHVIEPYMRYEYLTYPTSTPSEHYIFDINDGWFRLDTMRFGVNQSLYYKSAENLVSRCIYADLFAYAFFDTPTIHASIPRIYGKLIWNVFPTLTHCLNAAWDIERGEVFHYNFLTEWTISQNFAISTEYRHRSSFDWRKVEKYNFILDSFRTVHELRRSQLSDRRDTLLLHFFFRFDPNWAVEFESRHGWNRLFEPRYNEYEIDVLATLRSAWNVKVSFQHKENDKNDNRIAVYFSIGMKRPDREYCENRIPVVKF